MRIERDLHRAGMRPPREKRHPVRPVCSLEESTIQHYFKSWKGSSMKKEQKMAKSIEQPEPVTPGITRSRVRQHAFELFRDKLSHDRLTLEDWVLAEKD